MKKNIFKPLLVMAFSVMLLSACSGGGEEDRVVIDRFEQTIATIDSGDVTLDLKFKGQSGQEDVQETMDISVNLDILFDRADMNDPKANALIAFSTDAQAEDSSISGTGDMELFIFGKELLFKVNAFDLNNPQFLAFKPFLTPYFGNWLRLGEEMLPPELQSLQLEGEEAAAKRATLQTFFEGADMFKVVKSHGLKRLEDREVYHYEVEIDRQAFEEYVQAAAELDGQTLSPEELSANSELVESVETLELWIDVQTYQLAQASLLMSDFPQDPLLANQTNDVTIELLMTAKPFNQPVDIERPADEDIQDFDPTALLLGGAAFSADEFEVPEETLEDTVDLEETVDEEGVPESPSDEEPTEAESVEDGLVE